MKRTTILLEENLLLEVQQLAKEQQVTTSQVIQQAVADYVEVQRRSRSQPPVTEEASPSRSSASLAEPVQPVEARSEPASVGHQPIPAQGSQVRGKPFPWLALIFFVLGGLSAPFALVEFILTIGEFTSGVRPLEVTFNHLLPGLLLTLIAVGFLFVASQSWLSRAA